MHQKLMKYLPSYYRKSKVMKNLTQSQEEELQELIKKIGEKINQFYIDTADHSLERWEKDLGISISNEKNLEFRRSVIKSKLRGIGTVTANLLENVAQSYEKGDIEVKEDNKYKKFIIRFIDTLGAPPNLEDLKNAIEEIKPAHLIVDYQFKYLIINEVQKLTIGEIQQRPLTDFSPFVPII
ncbi:putative phage tail protein [Marinisporobacter balticus]|uniref:Uncharacterized protein DUF2313 n=1 Tax=Marinisporobacter balticus TaxID=2018667 RepID=A0A4R2KVZ2_9FIRM|nr:putative phage tail protein [Marinisporobacter balticus]TCO78013.1 uncharacterized protein DUF2313 [Marinisporobacter balticus]